MAARGTGEGRRQARRRPQRGARGWFPPEMPAGRRPRRRQAPWAPRAPLPRVCLAFIFRRSGRHFHVTAASFACCSFPRWLCPDAVSPHLRLRRPLRSLRAPASIGKHSLGSRVVSLSSGLTRSVSVSQSVPFMRQVAGGAGQCVWGGRAGVTLPGSCVGLLAAGSGCPHG